MSNQVATKTSPTTLKQKIQRLEKELQTLKWDIRPIKTKQSVVSATRGILGTRFSSGVSYQKGLRKDWERRVRRTGL